MGLPAPTASKPKVTPCESVYAPEATIDFKGNGDFFGSVVGATVLDVGNGAIHYDRKLKRKLFTVGNYMLDTFTWAKY